MRGLFLINIIKFVCTVVGTFIGAGFASGREIYSFFFKYGKLGIIGICISSLFIGYFLYIFHEKPVWAIPFCFLAMYKEPWALLGFGLTLTYNGERGRQNKIVNYLFYPVHLFVLGMIKMYFGF